MKNEGKLCGRNEQREERRNKGVLEERQKINAG
jgi:hypothetical protein